MERADLLAFARRDWARIAESKTAYWLARKAGMSASDILEAGDDLRRHARTVRPDWPSESERAADVAVHVRVSEALRAVSQRSR